MGIYNKGKGVLTEVYIIIYLIGKCRSDVLIGTYLGIYLGPLGI